MDAQILAAEREAHQRTKRTARGIFYGGIGALMLLPMIVVGVTTGSLIGLEFFAVMLIFMAGIIGMSVGLGILAAKGMANAYNNRLGMASPGPWSFGQVYTRAPAEQVWAALHQAVGISGMGSQQVGQTTIESVKAMGFVTPGAKYLIDLRPSSDRPGMGVVTIAARPAVPYAYHDMGVAQNTVNSLLLTVPGRELSGPMLPATPQDRFQSSRPALPSAQQAGLQAPIGGPGQQPYAQPQYAPQPNPQQPQQQRFDQ